MGNTHRSCVGLEIIILVSLGFFIVIIKCYCIKRIIRVLLIYCYYLYVLDVFENLETSWNFLKILASLKIFYCILVMEAGRVERLRQISHVFTCLFVVLDQLQCTYFKWILILNKFQGEVVFFMKEKWIWRRKCPENWFVLKQSKGCFLFMNNQWIRKGKNVLIIVVCIACENICFSSLFTAGDVLHRGTSTTQWQKFHIDKANQCLDNKSGSHGVPNVNLSNFTCLVVDFGKVLCSSAN